MAGCLATAAVPCVTADRVFVETYQYFTDKIRQVAGPELPLWWEVNVAWNFIVPSAFGSPLLPPIGDPQLGFSHHEYGVCGTVAAPAVVCDLHFDRMFQNHDDLAARTGRPILATEFGFTRDAVELERFLSRADQRLLGWHYWDYGNAFAPLDAGEEPFTTAQLDVLVRTFPQATAGTPTALAFDPGTGTTTYRFTPAAASEPTDIYVSSRHYPDGYQVGVRGASVTSAPCAPHLTLEADPNVTEVEVVVSDGPCGTVYALPQSIASELDGSDAQLPATGGGTKGVPWLLALIALALAARARLAPPRNPQITSESWPSQ